MLTALGSALWTEAYVAILPFVSISFYIPTAAREMVSRCFSALLRHAAKHSVVQIPWIGRMTNTVERIMRAEMLKTAILLDR